MNTTKVASTLVYLILANAEAERPIDKSRTAAAWEGGCKVANAAGFGHTETHVSMTVFDQHRAQIAEHGPRPLFRAMGNEARKEWDAQFIARTAQALDEIL